MTKTISEQAFELLAADDEGRACKDIPESACNEQPKNFFIHVSSLALTKSADGFVDPKLILSWIFSVLGVPTFFTGLLVPIREAGALLPQLFIAGFIRSLPIRKYVWALGSCIQGFAVVGIGLSALYLDGVTLGYAIVALLSILSLARSICSVSYKDVLGKTVDKSKRGTATGTASTVAAGVVIIYSLLLLADYFDKLTLVITGLFVAGLCWLLASARFLQLTEEPGATEGGGTLISVAMDNLNIVYSDRQFQFFILTRGLLTATALAPPFIVALATQDIASLGGFVLASSAASLCSSYVWGRLADRSSRRVLLYASLTATLGLVGVLVCDMYSFWQVVWAAPTVLFTVMIAYQGVRLGRTTHLVDMTDQHQRATYTALSNTIIGVVLLFGGMFSVIASLYGGFTVIALFALMTAGAAGFALLLDEVQE